LVTKFTIRRGRRNSFIVKRIVFSVILILVLAASVAIVTPASARGPEDEESFLALPVEVQEEIKKQLANPVYPSQRPPFTGEEKQSDGSRDIHSDIWDPWKEDNAAWGKSMTKEIYIYGRVRWVYAYVWLWRWENNEWVVQDSGQDWGYCAGVFPRCTVYAYAEDDQAQTAYYVNSSRHIIDDYELGRVYFNELEPSCE